MITIASLPLFAVAQSGQFTLKAKLLQSTNPEKVYLNYRLDGKNILDSADVINGAFNFAGALAGPLSAQLILDHTGVGIKKLGRKADMLSFYLEKGNLTLNSPNDSLKRAVIAGSKINSDNVAYQKLQTEPNNKISAINAEYMAASEDRKKDKNFTNSLEAEMNLANKQREEIQKQYIKQHPDSYISLMALVDIAGYSIDVPQIEPLYNSLSASIRNAPAGLEFGKTIESARATSVGAMAPVFVQNDVNDKPVKLIDFGGNMYYSIFGLLGAVLVVLKIRMSLKHINNIRTKTSRYWVFP